MQHLQKHLAGEVLAERSVLDYFSTDGSIFKIMPRVVVYPRNVTDVRKLVRFSWQLAEKGQILPVTARGKGTDQAGGALGEGIIMVLPAHLNKMLGFKKTDVVVQPGMLFGDLQRTLHSHNRFLPPYPSSIEFSTIGGAVANNACGEKTLKYGCMRDYVKSLDVVLSNGQLIRAEKITAKQLNHKKGQTDLEGEIYRQLDGLLVDNSEVINQARKGVSKNSAGYNLWDIKGKDGSFDISRLIAGSQGTLGVVSSVTLSTAAYNPKTHLMAAFFDDIEKTAKAVNMLTKFKPSAMEIVDNNLLDFLLRSQPQKLEGILEGELPKLVLLIEFDDSRTRKRVSSVKKATKVLQNYAKRVLITTDADEQEKLWQIRRSVAAVIWQDKGDKKALPIIEDGVVPSASLGEFLHGVYALFKKYGLQIAIWGHAGDANFHMQPFLDLANTGDRQTVIKLMDEFYDHVIKLGGSTCGEHNDGRLRAPYLQQLYGAEMYRLFREVKRIFDPYGILNPGVKLDVKKTDLLPIMRREYSMKHLYDNLPHLN